MRDHCGLWKQTSHNCQMCLGHIDWIHKASLLRSRPQPIRKNAVRYSGMSCLPSRIRPTCTKLLTSVDSHPRLNHSTNKTPIGATMTPVRSPNRQGGRDYVRQIAVPPQKKRDCYRQANATSCDVASLQREISGLISRFWKRQSPPVRCFDQMRLQVTTKPVSR